MASATSCTSWRRICSSSSPGTPARSTAIATGGRPGFGRTAATQTSHRSVLSGTSASQSSRLSMTAPLAWPSVRIRAVTRSARPRGAPRWRGSGCSGEADVRRIWPSGISMTSTAWAAKIRAAPAAAARASPSKVSAALMSSATLVSAVSRAAVRSARCRARE